MNQKILILIVVVALIIVSTIVYLNYQQADSRCNWEPRLCKNICQSQNYYFDSNSKVCEKYLKLDTNKGCCTPPPFETLEECKSVCE